MQVIRRRLVGKEGAERVRELRAILDELPGYRNGPYADIRKWVNAQIGETRTRAKVLHRDSIAVRREGAAQVAVVGPPNAGKSSLLQALSQIQIKTGDYAFTTTRPVPALTRIRGVLVQLVEIPGLIEGASEGRGLGHRFLRHIVRCRALVLVVDLSAEEPAADLATLRGELAAYDEDLARRPALVVGTKADLVDEASAAVGRLDPGAIAVSAVTGDGIDALAARLGPLAAEGEAAAPPREPFVVLRPGRPRFTVERERDRWRVRGRRVERWVLETDLDDEQAVAALQRKMAREGVDRRLRELGARPGDEVAIGERVFEFVPDAAADDGSR
jgi:GTPase